MSLKAYCANSLCGAVSLYDSAKPKFCGSCGQPFDAAFKAAAYVAPKPVIVIAPGPIKRVQYQRPEPIEPEIDFDNVEFSFKINENAFGKKMTLGDLQKMGGDLGVDRPRGNQIDPEQVMAKVRAEAAKRESIDVGGSGGSSE